MPRRGHFLAEDHPPQLLPRRTPAPPDKVAQETPPAGAGHHFFERRHIPHTRREGGKDQVEPPGQAFLRRVNPFPLPVKKVGVCQSLRLHPLLQGGQHGRGRLQGGHLCPPVGQGNGEDTRTGTDVQHFHPRLQDSPPLQPGQHPGHASSGALLFGLAFKPPGQPVPVVQGFQVAAAPGLQGIFMRPAPDLRPEIGFP